MATTCSGAARVCLPVAGERPLGWFAHYAIGVAFALVLLAVWGSTGRARMDRARADRVGVGHARESAVGVSRAASDMAEVIDEHVPLMGVSTLQWDVMPAGLDGDYLLWCGARLPALAVNARGKERYVR